MFLKRYISLFAQQPLPVLLLLSTIGWLLLWFGGSHDHGATSSAASAMESHGHHHNHSHHAPVDPAGPGAHVQLMAVDQMVGWIIMVFAMMFPLLHNAIRHIWQRSLPRLRLLGCLAFCSAYLALWTTVGYIFNIVLQFFQPVSSEMLLLGASVAAIVWQASPWKQWALNYCHYTQRLSLSGLVYQYDCLLFGFKKGAWCVFSCWHLMLLPMLLDSFVLMFIGMLMACVWMFVEQHSAPRRPKWGAAFQGGFFVILDRKY